MDDQIQTEKQMHHIWRFRPANLGGLASNAGDIGFRPLTLVCGPNNTGKTQVMYAFYGFLNGQYVADLPRLDGLTKELAREGQSAWDFGAWLATDTPKIIDAINEGIRRNLPSLFNSTPDFFRHSRFDWRVTPEELIKHSIASPMDFRLMIGRDKNEMLRLHKPAGDRIVQINLLSEQVIELGRIVSNAILRHMLGHTRKHSVFLMPAERNGLHLFYRELANRRTALLHHAAKKDKDIDIGQLIEDVIKSRYAQPIADYIDWLNDLPDLRKRKRGPYHDLAEEIKKLVGGRYAIDAEGEISFTPYKLTKGSAESSPKMDLHLTSSTVKSLFGLWGYLEFQAQPGDVLMIDEPELNLHPGNQRRFARLLARLVNDGLNVVISTHSDYLVREMNSLIMLSRNEPPREKLMKRFGYDENEILDPEKVAAWLFCDRRISAMDIDAIEGINATTFDEEIHNLNTTSDDIYYGYRESAEDMS